MFFSPYLEMDFLLWDLRQAYQDRCWIGKHRIKVEKLVPDTNC